VYLAPVEGFPWNFVTAVVLKKTRECSCLWAKNITIIIFIHSDTVAPFYGPTDGRN